MKLGVNNLIMLVGIELLNRDVADSVMSNFVYQSVNVDTGRTGTMQAGP